MVKLMNHKRLEAFQNVFCRRQNQDDKAWDATESGKSMIQSVMDRIFPIADKEGSRAV